MVVCMASPQSAADFMDCVRSQLKKLARKRRIVFPEGDDPRVVEAAARLRAEGLVEPVLVSPSIIETCPKLRQYASIYHERRRAKGVTQSEAAAIAKRPLYFSCLMVAAGDAEGFVGGAANTTGETVRAAFHCIGAKAGVKTVSSTFIVCVHDRSYGHRGLMAFADCAIVISPTPSELADIAIATAETTRVLIGTEPAVALLSFSTKGSGRSPQSERIAEALRIVRERAPALHVDGEMQADAALVPAVGQSKARGSTVAGRANTLVFPDLGAGNIGVKLVERLGDAVTLGPFLQGLAKPCNDLSRGCSVEDIHSVALVTALQAG